MEDRNDKRRDEIVAMPTNNKEAHEMLDKVHSLLENFRIVGHGISGSLDQGFAFNK